MASPAVAEAVYDEEAEFEVVVSTTGFARAVYKDEMQELYKRLGKVTVQRASHIEWEENRDDFSGQVLEAGWVVRAYHDPKIALRWLGPCSKHHIGVFTVGPVVYFQSREEALHQEMKFFWELLPSKSQVVNPNRKEK